jgi:hypothetical protein
LRILAELKAEIATKLMTCWLKFDTKLNWKRNSNSNSIDFTNQPFNQTNIQSHLIHHSISNPHKTFAFNN